MQQGYFLNSTCDIGINKRQRHATLAFLKIDRRHGNPPPPPAKGPQAAAVAVHAAAPFWDSQIVYTREGFILPYQHNLHPSPIGSSRPKLILAKSGGSRQKVTSDLRGVFGRHVGDLTSSVWAASEGVDWIPATARGGGGTASFWVGT